MISSLYISQLQIKTSGAELGASCPYSHSLIALPDMQIFAQPPHSQNIALIIIALFSSKKITSCLVIAPCSLCDSLDSSESKGIQLD